MTREEIIRKITDTPKPFSVHPIKRICAEKELLEYEQKIRAEAFEEVLNLKHYAFKEDDNNMYIRMRDVEQLKEQSR